MSITLIWSFVGVVLIFILGITWATLTYRRQGGEERDSSTNPTLAKHPIIANPIFWTYVAFGIVMLTVIYSLSIYFNDY